MFDNLRAFQKGLGFTKEAGPEITPTPGIGPANPTDWNDPYYKRSTGKVLGQMAGRFGKMGLGAVSMQARALGRVTSGVTPQQAVQAVKAVSPITASGIAAGKAIVPIARRGLSALTAGIRPQASRANTALTPTGQ